jgi:hypothetical protein
MGSVFQNFSSSIAPLLKTRFPLRRDRRTVVPLFLSPEAGVPLMWFVWNPEVTEKRRTVLVESTLLAVRPV